jgi:hypothetical protein
MLNLTLRATWDSAICAMLGQLLAVVSAALIGRLSSRRIRVAIGRIRMIARRLVWIALVEIAHSIALKKVGREHAVLCRRQHRRQHLQDFQQ